MEQFKTYLKTQLKTIESQLLYTIKEIEKIPSPESINLSKYNSLNKLKVSFIKETKPKFIKRILGPTKNELKQFIFTKEINRLKDKKKLYEQKISELQNAINSINNNQIIRCIYPNSEIIKYLLEYATTSNKKPKEILNILILLCKQTTDNKKVEDKIKLDIASFYDTNNNVIKDEKIDTICLLFDKLFYSILSKEEIKKYFLTIKQILTEVKLGQTEPETKEQLENKKNALIELQSYINGSNISKTLDIQYFEQLLNIVDVPQNIKEEQIKLMNKKLQEEAKAAEIQKLKIIMEIYLSKEEIELIDEANELTKTSKEPIKSLIERTKNDIISICKYLSITEQSRDTENIIETLSDRTKILTNVLECIKKEPKIENSLYFITDKEGIPTILRNIEVLNVNDYYKIYELLNNLSLGKKGKHLFTKEGIDFYCLKSTDLSILYTIHDQKKIVIEANKRLDLSIAKKLITQNIINKIKEIQNAKSITELRNVHSIYESIILERLNVKEIPHTITLKRK